MLSVCRYQSGRKRAYSVLPKRPKFPYQNCGRKTPTNGRFPFPILLLLQKTFLSTRREAKHLETVPLGGRRRCSRANAIISASPPSKIALPLTFRNSLSFNGSTPNDFFLSQVGLFRFNTTGIYNIKHHFIQTSRKTCRWGGIALQGIFISF